VVAQNGCEVVLKDVSEEYLRAGFEALFIISHQEAI